MAPKGRGGGSSSSSGSSKSSSTCYNSNNKLYPCTVPFYHLYGDIDGPLYSNADLHGQLITYACWILVLFIAFLVSKKSGKRVLQFTMLLFLASFIFVCVRYALLLTGTAVPVGYRYESSIAELLWRIGMVALLASAVPGPKGRAAKIVIWVGLAVYAALSIAFVVYDFVISSVAIKGFKDSPSRYGWKLTDRDFGLTLTQGMLDRLEGNSRLYGVSSFNSFVEEKLYDVYNGLFHEQRAQQIRVEVAADIIALLLVVAMLSIAVARRSKGEERVPGKKWIITAIVALLPTILFSVIISTAFVLRNYSVLAEVKQDIKDKAKYSTNPYDLSYRGEHFGRIYVRYNATSMGFPVIQAVFKPLGVVVACIALMMFWRTKAKQVQVQEEEQEQ